MEPIIKRNAEIVELCKKYHVLQLFAFGSVVKNRLTNESDIDFLVYFKDDLPLLDYADNFFDLIYDLEKLLDRKIDLVSGKAMKNPYFIQEVEKTKQLVYDFHNQEITV
jgi:predicted nucleotidyltransferase